MRTRRRSRPRATGARPAYRRCFYRDGFCPRTLLSLDAWARIWVPRVSCVCGGMVDYELVHLSPYGRLWFDVGERARQLAAICVSLRDGAEVLSWGSGQVFSIATVNRLTNEAAGLAEAFHAGTLEWNPPLVMPDGLWLKVREPTGAYYLDKHGRRRQFGRVAEHLPRVFDRFYRVDSACGAGVGSGLGLAIAKALVTAQKGEIGIESEVGKGTRVFLVLPAAGR